jgi:GAF domain-containing protein
MRFLASNIFIARTKTTLADMNIIGSAQTDPFFISKTPKSLLCLPLVSQKTLQAVLYLHSRKVNAFQEDEREVLKVLSVQAATSLEKLSIYQELDRTNNALVDLNRQVGDQSRKLAEEVKVRTAELHAKIEELKLAKDVLEQAKDEAERSKLEAERSQDEAVKANLLKSTFLATMSHEIRTPFNAVSTQVESTELGSWNYGSFVRL